MSSVTVSVQVLADDSAFHEICQAAPESVTVVSPKHFHGGADLTQAIVALSSLTLPLLAKVLTEAIKARKFVSIKMNGVEIKGLTADNALEILKELHSSPQPAKRVSSKSKSKKSTA